MCVQSLVGLFNSLCSEDHFKNRFAAIPRTMVCTNLGALRKEPGSGEDTESGSRASGDPSPPAISARPPTQPVGGPSTPAPPAPSAPGGPEAGNPGPGSPGPGGPSPPASHVTAHRAGGEGLPGPPRAPLEEDEDEAAERRAAGLAAGRGGRSVGKRSDALYDHTLAVLVLNSLASERHMAQLSRIYGQQNGSGYLASYIFDRIGQRQREKILKGMPAPERRSMTAQVGASLKERREARLGVGGLFDEGGVLDHLREQEEMNRLRETEPVRRAAIMDWMKAEELPEWGPKDGLPGFRTPKTGFLRCGALGFIRAGESKLPFEQVKSMVLAELEKRGNKWAAAARKYREKQKWILYHVVGPNLSGPGSRLSSSPKLTS